MQLNDPFDCQPVCEKGVTFDEFVMLLHPVLCAIRTEMGREVSPWYFSPAEMLRIIAGHITSEEPSVIQDVYDVRLDRMIANMFQTMGILSLTRDNNNLVMWSMYASRGNGICIEFEDLRFRVGLNEVIPVQVRYESSRPIFNYLGAVALFCT